MMQASKDGRRGHSVSWREYVFAWADRILGLERFWKSWPEGRMWPAAIVMGDPLFENQLEMLLAERNEKVKAFTPYRSDQALTKGIRLGASHGRLHHSDAEHFDGGV